MIVALAVGAATGTGLVLGFFALQMVAAAFTDPMLIIGGFMFLMLAIPFALGIWGLGLLFAIPGWLLLHRWGVRSRLVAAGYGALLTFVVVLAVLTGGFDLIPPAPGSSFSASVGDVPTVIENRLTAQGWINAAHDAAMVAIAGAMVGWVVARVAYGRAKS